VHPDHGLLGLIDEAKRLDAQLSAAFEERGYANLRERAKAMIKTIPELDGYFDA
jgi:hypothetical protein